MDGYVQQRKLLCNCCKFRQPHRYVLLDSTKIKSIRQSDFYDNHDFYNNCKTAFSAGHN